MCCYECHQRTYKISILYQTLTYISIETSNFDIILTESCAYTYLYTRITVSGICFTGTHTDLVSRQLAQHHALGLDLALPYSYVHWYCISVFNMTLDDVELT